MPELEPTNSPTTAPTTQSVTDTLRPPNRLGSALGSLILTKESSAEAFMDLARSRTSGSIDLSPTTVATTMGKKPSSKATTIFGKMPKPNQTTKRGAIATFGTLWEKTRIG